MGLSAVDGEQAWQGARSACRAIREDVVCDDCRSPRIVCLEPPGVRSSEVQHRIGQRPVKQWPHSTEQPSDCELVPTVEFAYEKKAASLFPTARLHSYLIQANESRRHRGGSMRQAHPVTCG